jgi:lipid-binding SYLF domain-containing protein
MKLKIHTIALAALGAATLCLCPLDAQADDDLRKESEQGRANFLKADAGLQKFFDESAGYALFPSIGKGGLVVGAARGKGIVYQKTNVVGEAVMTQASIGAQAGGQTFAEVIFFETPEALKDFKGGKFEMSAEVSAIAAAEGVSKTAKYKNGVAVFTLPHKGLMVQASVGGQKFKFIPAE